MQYNSINISKGGMYQEWMGLIDLVDEDAAKMLNEAAKNGWREVQPDEAVEMGFEELVDWSKPETDILVLIDNNYLVCLNKKGLCARVE